MVPHGLFSDGAKAAFSYKIQGILCHFSMGHYGSDPLQQNQNYSKCRIQYVKKQTNILLGCWHPATMWLLCMLYVIDLHNHLSSTNLPLRITPIQKAFGFVPDISKFLQFH